MKPTDRHAAAPTPTGMKAALRRNIRTMDEWRAQGEARATFGERLAGAITRFAGSMWSVYAHTAVFGAWALVNFGLVPGVPRFDPTFVLLATIASVEGIYLTTFVLISQNRMQAAADRRSDLDLHVDLLAEHELSRLIALTGEVARKLGVEPGDDPEFAEISKDIRPEAVLDELEKHREE